LSDPAALARVHALPAGTKFTQTVTGTCMTPAGIFDGDQVILRRQDHAPNGQIVAATYPQPPAGTPRLVLKHYHPDQAVGPTTGSSPSPPQHAHRRHPSRLADRNAASRCTSNPERKASQMTRRHLPILSDAQREGMNPSLLEPIEYRKSGLSLNHIVGCPLDCAYCVRHLFDNFDMKTPRALMRDEDAVQLLTGHRFFQPHVTPIQVFNRATDPFLQVVKPHTFAVLEHLDALGLRNHVLVITRWHITSQDCERLNQLANLRVTLLLTHSGIDHPQIEPVDSNIAARSLRVAFEHARRYRVVLYWRPLVPGLNDTDAHIARARELSRFAHAVVFTGLFYRAQIQAFYRQHGLPEPYSDTARRKVLPAELERRILQVFGQQGPDGLRAAGTSAPLFRKTSCGVAYAHGLTDYNGHHGIRELCDICPARQLERCQAAFRRPDQAQVEQMAAGLGATGVPVIGDRAIIVAGLDEQRRYLMQHTLGYQVHDATKPHHYRRHGRAEIGWTQHTGSAVEEG